MSARGAKPARSANSRDHGATVLVAALAAAFATGLILLTGVMTAAMGIEEMDAGTFKSTFLVIAGIFIVIALYVGAIVTANTFATVVAGRTKQIALLRLLGATSARVRSRVAGEGLAAGAIGAVIGGGIATLGVWGFTVLGPGWGALPEGIDYPVFDPLVIVALVVVIATTWLAAWSGSRRVAGVSPIAATGATVERTAADARRAPARTVFSLLLMIGGAGMLAIGIALGLVNPLAILVSFIGGLLSFTGIAIGAHLVMPPLLKLAGKLVGAGPVGRVATANAERAPERTARSTIGLVIGITLVTMFAVALASYQSMMLDMFGGDTEEAAAMVEAFAVTTLVCSALVGFSAIIAAVGMVNSLSLGVYQRQRELGLLRALGFTGGQVRRMVIAESAQMTIAALGFGLVLGVFYGWAAAQTLMGSQVGLVAPTIPWGVLAAVVGFGVVLAAVAAASPARRAVRVSPVAALAVA